MIYGRILKKIWPGILGDQVFESSLFDDAGIYLQDGAIFIQ